MFHLLPIMGLTLIVAMAPQAASTEDGPVEGAAVGAGLKVVVDPVTGRIVDSPSDAQLAALSAGLEAGRGRSAWELREFRMSGGGRGVYLDGWADHSLSVEVTADGDMRFMCSQGDDHSRQADRSEDGAR